MPKSEKLQKLLGSCYESSAGDLFDFFKKMIKADLDINPVTRDDYDMLFKGASEELRAYYQRKPQLDFERWLCFW